MNRIKLLKNETIEKIAAGEVIERPSSIVKELVENSLDANADEVTVEIKNGGKTYIRVTDNGDGINEEDLELAFKRYSTSKLSTIEDLYRIKSLGFRGEALSSISHVAKVEVMTKVGNAISGIQSFFEEGKMVSKEIIGCQKGTTMIIRDLFYNLPVRKKFLKSELAESNHISDMVYKIALGNPEVSFKFIKDNKIILRTSKNNQMKSHIYSILGKEFSNNLTEINQEENGIGVKGYISNNELYRGNRNHQYLYINGRFVKNHIISYTIEKFYKSIIPLNRFPCFIVFLDISPSSIDVNIHPTKEEVKFSNHEDVISVIEKAVKNALYPSITIPKMIMDKSRSKEEAIPLLFELENIELENIDTQNVDMEKDFIIKDFTTNSNFNMDSIEKYNGENLIVREDKVIENKSILDNLVLNGKVVGIVFNTYIIIENPLEEKIYLIDQHAAHERVMYERYLLEYRNDSIHSQQLISPEILQLTNHEMNIYNNNSSLFNKLGFEVEPFGNSSVAIRAVPLIFGHPNLRDLFFDILDNIDEVKTSYDTRLDKIMKIACTKAIKSGDIISKTEIFSLIKQLSKTENPNSCPHGRPTIMTVEKKDIEKAFLRIV